MGSADRHTGGQGEEDWVAIDELSLEAARELYGHSDADGIARGGNPEG